MAEDDATRGWLPVLGLSLAAAALSVVPPVLLIFVPFGLLLLGLAPDRPFLAVAGAVLAATAMLGAATGPLWYAERGWVYVLAAWFLLASVLMPPDTSFFPRGLLAVAATFASTTLALLVRPGGWTRVDAALAAQFRSGASQVAQMWRSAGLGQFGGDVAKAASRAATMQAELYPALLALASLAALAVAWWGYRRLVRADPRPLARLRDFRFHDELVWLVILGLALWLVPLGVPGRALPRVGLNLLVFMGTLYAFRGVAVLLAMTGTPGPLGAILAALVFIFLYPFVMGAALIVGLSDTWLDFRTRRREAGGVS